MGSFPPVLQLIPQRPPFVMIDEILEATEDSVSSRFCIPEDNPLVINRIFGSPGMIENMAQTAAAMLGLANSTTGKEPTVGVIGAVKKLEIHGHAKAGDVIQTRILAVSSFENASIVEGEVECTGTILARCQLNIFLLNS